MTDDKKDWHENQQDWSTDSYFMNNLQFPENLDFTEMLMSIKKSRNTGKIMHSILNGSS